VTEATARELQRLFADHEVVDLTLPIAENLPCTWPGHMPFRATVWTWFTDRDEGPQPVRARMGGSYQTRWLVLDEHVGTHLDAPRHVVPPPDSGLPHAGDAGGIGVADLPVLAACGPAAVVPATGSAAPGRSPAIEPDHIVEWERRHGALHAGEVVLLATGWDAHYRPGADGAAYGEDVLLTGRRPGWPAPTPATVALLRERGVRCLGTDGLSVGPADDGGPTHRAGLAHGMTYIEGLTNLDRLPARGAWFLFLPIKLVDGTGGPGRAIAVV
jgi:kynurenine formamidase